MQRYEKFKQHYFCSTIIVGLLLTERTYTGNEIIEISKIKINHSKSN